MGHKIRNILHNPILYDTGFLLVRRKPVEKPTLRMEVSPSLEERALKKVPVFGKTNKKAASYCTSEQFSDGQILSLFCLTQWLRYLYNDLQRVI